MVMGDLAVKYDVAVIGSGPGGYVAALRAGQLGKSVVLIEDTFIGGVCLNVGCIPSKALIHATSFFREILTSQDFGITAEKITLDTEKMQSWKRDIVKKLTDGIQFLCKQYNVDIIRGKAFLKEGGRSLGITTEKGVSYVDFNYCIIATGSKPIELPSVKFDGKNILSSTEALALENVPSSLIVIGGGYIGLELGTVYAKLGSQVTVIERSTQLLSGLDPEIVNVLQKHLTEMGITVHLNAAVEKTEVTSKGVTVYVLEQDKKNSLVAEKVLLAIGRKPYREGLLLENSRVQLDEKGFIKVDDQLRTNDTHIFAIGDITGNPMLAHRASRQAKIAAEVIAGHKVGYDNQVVPAVVFTDPEIAYVGLQEHEARAQGRDILVGKFPFKALGRALAMHQSEGFVKIIADKTSQVVLGVEIIGPHASDLIAECGFAIEMGAQLEDLASTIHAHPTLPEAIMEAAEDALGKCVHQGKKKPV